MFNWYFNFLFLAPLRILPIQQIDSILSPETIESNGNRWNHVYVDGISKKGNNIGVHPKLFNGDRLNLYGTFNEKVIPCLEFSMEFQSNKLIYQKEYTKRQQIIYVLIQHLHDREGWGYRKISNWLNQSGIKTHRGKKWFNSSVISVLKRKHEYDLRIQQIRNQHFPTKISKLEVNYYTF